MYSDLPFDREELKQVMREGYDDLIAFVTTPEFKTVCAEMGSRPASERPAFVKSVLLNEEELMERGVNRPEDILLQRSSFGDRRPTLFCVKKFLPEKYHVAWENVNLTFDNEFIDSAVPRDGAKAWRRPLPVEVQSDLLMKDIDLEALSDKLGLKTGAFGSQRVAKLPNQDD